MLIEPDAFAAGFTNWVGLLVERRKDDPALVRSWARTVAVARGERLGQGAGPLLGQRCVDGKSNEITAVPGLLDQLVLGNSIVTLDAVGCQTAIAERTVACGGDHLGSP
jgi:hypothetical protein